MRGVSVRMRRQHRPWLARLRRGLVWIAVPLILAAAALSATRIHGVPNSKAIFANAIARLLEASASFGLRVNDIRVEGRATTDRETVLDALGARPGTPIFAVDPTHAKRQLESLPWVRSAAIERRLPDTIYVRLVEREPMALWQHGGRIDL